MRQFFAGVGFELFTVCPGKSAVFCEPAFLCALLHPVQCPLCRSPEASLPPPPSAGLPELLVPSLQNISFSLLLVSAYQFTCPFFKDICFYTLDILSHHTKIRKKYILLNHCVKSLCLNTKKAVLISDSLFYSFISSVRSISDMH